MENKKIEYPCTNCGGDAYVGYSNWYKNPKKKLIKKKERLCSNCAAKRVGKDTFFELACRA